MTQIINNAKPTIKTSAQEASAVVPIVKKQKALKEILAFNKKAYDKVYHAEVEGAERAFTCVDYIDDIFAYLREVEREFVLPAAYLTGKATTENMRTWGVKWISELHNRLNLLPETLSLSVYVFDAYLAAEDVGNTGVQLAASTALFVAAKFEERKNLRLNAAQLVAVGICSKRQILNLESKLLMNLHFNLKRPAHITFLRYLSGQFKLLGETQKRAEFFVEICIQYYKLCHLRPSHAVIIAISLAAAMDGEQIDMDTLLKGSGLERTQMEESRAYLAYAVSTNHKHPMLRGISNKYSSLENRFVADLSPEERKWLATQFDKS